MKSLPGWTALNNHFYACLLKSIRASFFYVQIFSKNCNLPLQRSNNSNKIDVKFGWEKLVRGLNWSKITLLTSCTTVMLLYIQIYKIVKGEGVLEKKNPVKLR